MSLQFYYNDLWGGGTLTPWDEHPNFPAELTQHRDFNLCYRSNYGSENVGGSFYISNDNKYLDFDEGGGELTATLTTGKYSADELAAEIETQLEAAGAHSYTVTYSHSTYKFTITDDTGTVTLLSYSGSNAANAIFDDIGFDTTGDHSTAASHEADDPRIHTHVAIVIDLGSAQLVKGFFFKGHNLENPTLVKVQFSADNFSTTAENETMTQDDADTQIYYWIDPSGHTYRYLRLLIVDRENSAGYVKIGTPWAAPVLQPASSHQHGSYRETPADLSDVRRSAGGQKSSVQYGRPRSYAMRLRLAAGEKATFDAMIDDRGYGLPLFMIPDSSSPDPKYVTIVSSNFTPLRMSADTWYLDLELEDEV